jgi:hypothetical protein
VLGPRSDEDRLFERIDRLEAEVAHLRSMGIFDSVVETFARKLRIATYAYKGITRRTLAEVEKSRDPAVLERWDKMWPDIEAGALHPREIFEFYRKLTGAETIP